MDSPAWLMCPPDYYTADVANNVWMEELADREVDKSRAMAQWLGLYDVLTSQGIVYLQPPQVDLQDQVFAANAGVLVGEYVVVSHHSTEPRHGEEAAAHNFLTQFCRVAHTVGLCFEGEADFKHLHDNVWVGGYGQRTERGAIDALAQMFRLNVVPLEQTDPYLYHLDGSLFPLTEQDTVVYTQLYQPHEVQALEAVTNVIDVDEDLAYAGITNSIRAGHLVLNGSHIHDLRAGTDEYASEVAKNRRLEDLCGEHDLEPVFLNISEFHKGGALLSCLAMRLA